MLVFLTSLVFGQSVNKPVCKALEPINGKCEEGCLSRIKMCAVNCNLQKDEAGNCIEPQKPNKKK